MLSRRIHSILLLLALLIGGVGMNYVQAQNSGNCGANDYNLTWSFYEATGTLTISGSGAMAGYAVNDVPWAAFRDAITSVVLPNGLTNIGSNAFNRCTQITYITIPSNVTEIGITSFYGCTKLTYVGIPSSVTTIKTGAFQDCTSLTTIIIPNSVTSIGSQAFYGTSSLTSICVFWTENIPKWTSMTNKSGITLYVPCGTKSLYKSTTGWKNYTVVDTPSGTCGAQGDNLTWSLSCTGVLTISGSGSMAKWSVGTDVPWHPWRENITSVVLPYGLTDISPYAFVSCQFKTIDIPASVTVIGAGVFTNSLLEDICLPEGITSLPSMAFGSNLNLQPRTHHLRRIYLPSTLTTIGDYAISRNINIENLTFPESVTSIGITPVNQYAHARKNVYASWKTDIPARQGRVESLNSPKAKMHVPYGTSSAYSAKGWSYVYQLVEDVDERAIDLGLSIRWASCNIGATAPEESGEYYMWADTLGGWDSYDKAHHPYYKSNQYTRYNSTDHRTRLIPFDDAAYINWGETWRMPTKDEWNELFTQCTWEKEKLNDEWVYKVTGPNGNYIYIPLAGYKQYGYLYKDGSGSYWTSELYSSGAPFATHIAGSRNSGPADPSYGRSIRAVYRREWPSFTLTITDTPEGTSYTKAINAAGTYTLTAQEDDCHTFVRWSDGNTNKTRTVTATADAVYIAEYETRHGTCGATGNEANVTWSLSCDSTLTISGTGAMADYTNTDNLPWVTYRDAIKTIVVEEGVTTIGDRAFGYSANATSVTIPSSVTSIGDYAFIGCSSLQEITIPNTTCTLGRNMLYACSSLTDIYVPWELNIPARPINFTNNSPQSSVTLHVPCGSKSGYEAANGWKDYTLEADISNVKSGTYGPDNIEWTFDYCDSLLTITGNGELHCDENTWGPNAGGINPNAVKSVFIGKGVTYLGIYTLSYMTNIEYIEIEEGHPTHRTGCNAIIRIGSEQEGDTLIFGCPHTVIPTTCTTIRGYGFSDNHRVTEMTIPSSVKQIANMQGSLWQGNNGQVFYTSNSASEGLKDLYVEWTKLEDIPAVPNNRLGDMTKVRLHVPCGTTSLYKQVTGWSKFKEYIEESSTFTITVQAADPEMGDVSIFVN